MTEKVLGLFVDGVRQTPLETNMRPEEGCLDHFSFYKMPVKEPEVFVNFYLCPNSLIEVNSQRYIDNAHRMYETNGGYSTVMAEWVISKDDLFLGNNELYGSSTKGCELDSVELTVTGTDKVKYHLEGVEIFNSTIWDTKLTGAVVVEHSEIFDSTVQCDTGKFYRTTVVESSLFAKGHLVISEATLEDCEINAMDGDLFIGECKFRDVKVYAPRISWLSVFHTFEIKITEMDKLYIAVRFIRLEKGKYALCDDNGWWVMTDFEDVKGRIMDLGKHWDSPMDDPLAQYIIDCAESRIKVIEMLEARKGNP